MDRHKAKTRGFYDPPCDEFITESEISIWAPENLMFFFSFSQPGITVGAQNLTEEGP
jgi:hypothetical protein